MGRDLTERQRAILEFIRNLVLERGYPPTLREIGEHFHIASPFGVKRHLDALQRKGFLHRESGARGLRLSLLPGSPSAGRLAELPLVGRVAAGIPITAIENREDTLFMSPELAGGMEGMFLLQVKGDSMADLIMEGDLVMVRSQPHAHDGQIVVALVDGEATVKYFHRRKGKVILRPHNPAYNDIEARGPLAINGVVTGLLRRF